MILHPKKGINEFLKIFGKPELLETAKTTGKPEEKNEWDARRNEEICHKFVTQKL